MREPRSSRTRLFSLYSLFFTLSSDAGVCKVGTLKNAVDLTVLAKDTYN